MKSRKGFTLVELLAVVVILGLIVLISIPAVNKYILNSREESYEIAKKSMISAAKNLMTECEGRFNGDTELDYCKNYPVPDKGKTLTIPLQDLITLDYIKPIEDPGKKGENCDPNNSYVVVKNITQDEINVILDYSVNLFCPSRDYDEGITENIDDDFIVIVTSTVNGNNYLYGTWVKDDIVVKLNTSYTGGTVKKYQYKTKGQNNWTDITNGDTITFSTSMNGLYQFRGLTEDNRSSSNWEETKDYRIDKEIPSGSVSLSGDKNENSSDVLYKTNVVASCGKITDNYSGVKECGVSLSKNGPYTESVSIDSEALSHTVYMRAVDNVDNVLEKSKTFGIDKTAPSLNSITAKTDDNATYISGTWTNKTVKLLGNATDNLQVNKIVYKAGSENEQKLSPGTYFDITDTKDVTVSVYAEDKALHKSGTKTISVKIDKIKPTVNKVNGLNSSYGLSQTITVEGKDTGGSGLHAQAYSFDNGSSWQENPKKTYSSNGDVNIKVRDAAGNISDTKKVTLNRVDKEGPNVTVRGNSTNWVAQVKLEIDATDNGTGLDSLPYSFDNGSTWTKTASKIYKENGTVKIIVRDKLGNTTSKTVNITKVDNVKPNISDLTITSRSGSTPTATATCTDNESGVKNSSVNASCDTSGKCTATCEDKVGNKNSKSASYTWATNSICGQESYTYTCNCNPSYCCAAYNCTEGVSGGYCHTIGVVHGYFGNCMCDGSTVIVGHTQYSTCLGYCRSIGYRNSSGGSLSPRLSCPDSSWSLSNPGSGQGDCIKQQVCIEPCHNCSCTGTRDASCWI